MTDCPTCGPSAPVTNKHAPPIMLPVAAPPSKPPRTALKNRSMAQTSAAAVPGAGAKAVMDRLATSHLRPGFTGTVHSQTQNQNQTQKQSQSQSQTQNQSKGKAPAKVPVQPTVAPQVTIESAAAAAGLPQAAATLSKAASFLAPDDAQQHLLGDLWKKHQAETANLKDELEKKLTSSMAQLKALNLGKLASSGALSGFDASDPADVHSAKLRDEDVKNADFLRADTADKSHTAPQPEIDDLDAAMPISGFSAARLAEHNKNMHIAMSAAMAAAGNHSVARPGTTDALNRLGAGASASILQTTDAHRVVKQTLQQHTDPHTINQHLRTKEMHDRRARHAANQRSQIDTKSDTTTDNKASATSAAKGVKSIGLPAPTAGLGLGLGDSMAQMQQMTEQMKAKLASATATSTSTSGLGGLGGLGAASPAVQQQAELVSTLSQQLQNWNLLANKMGSMQTYMGVFGKHVRLMLGVQDDSRHYSVQHFRGPLLTLLDNDTVKWYRRNDVAQSFANAGCTLAWQGSASAPGEPANSQKRFQLQWQDVVIDSQQRPVAVGTTWNATSQRLNVAVARFTADGKSLDPAFYADAANPSVGGIQSSIFQTESRGQQALLTADQLRLLVLASVYDQEAQQMVGTICALQTTNGQLDTAWGNSGTVGLTAQGYQGCLGVRMAMHPVTGEVVVLLRLETSGLAVNKLTSMFVKLTPDGALSPGFSAVFVDSDNNPTNPSAWLATDIAWSVPEASDRSADRIVVVGTIVSQLGDETSQAFVRQYLADGQLDTAFGLPMSAVPTLLNSTPSDGATAVLATPVELLDLSADETAPSAGGATGASATGTAGYFATLNAADDAGLSAGNAAVLGSLTAGPTGIAPPPNVLQTGPSQPTSHPASSSSSSGALSGLMLLNVSNSAVAMAQRVIVYDQYIEVLGVAYDDVQGSYGESFICQIDLSTQNQNLMTLRLADLYQTTVAQNFAIDFDSGTRCIVGYALRNATQVDSADAFVIKLDAQGNVLQKSRLALGGEHFQSITAVACDTTNSRMVCTGMVQTGKTIYTRLGCLILGPSLP